MTIDEKNAFLIVAILFLVGIVGLYVPYQRSGRASIPTTASNTPDHRTILYTNSGFEPPSLTIAVGTTVEWINVSEKPLWIASDPHPSHTDLPGFDQKKIENAPNSSFNTVPFTYAHTQTPAFLYTFRASGHWGYHNHLVPTDRGNITVE